MILVRLDGVDIDPDVPTLRRDLLRGGVTDDEVRRAVRTGEWEAVRPGAYLPSSLMRSARPEQRYRYLVLATVRRLAGDPVVSHLSAAAMHGLPLWDVPLRTVHVTQDARSGGRRTAHVHRHVASVEPDEVVVIDGLRVTCLARTVADVARTVPFESAVCLADSALRREGCSRELLDAAVERAGRRRGGPASRRVIAFADGLAHDPGESRSRVRMRRHGLPAPELQQVFHDAAGRFVGQVDFWWREAGVIGEFDGMVKYGRSLTPDLDPAEVVRREKLREDALRAQPGVRTVARWTWPDLDDFAPLAARLHALLSR